MRLLELNEARLKSLKDVKRLIPKILNAVQKEYDNWSQDEEGHDEDLGFGGLCQNIADEIAGTLNFAGIDVGTVSATMGEQHVWCICKIAEGVYQIDIPPHVYETGAGYNWKKRPGVVFYA